MKNIQKSNVKIYDANDNYTRINFSNILFTKYVNSPSRFCPKYSINSLYNLNSFMLIIDFPNLGGGSTFFLNSVISKYKTNKYFLIARNINNQLVLNINEDYELTTTYNLKESIQFLHAIKHKIIKIFVNHTMGHDELFLNEIFNLGKHVTTITHDYSLLYKNPQPYYCNIPNLPKCAIDINLYDRVITQNTVNLNIYKKLTNEVIVSPLPDFMNSVNRIKTHNSKLIIGVIGAIGDIKGQTLIQLIINFYRHKNVLVVIFGITNIKYKYVFPYKSIHELNNLLLTWKPNLLIETSLWPETYSYTLTIKMLTQLPILFFKKPFPSVIENRLSTYNKAYGFSSIGEIDKLIYNVKQNYFYLIEPVIYYNSFWDNYFLCDEPIMTNNFKMPFNLLNSIKQFNKNIIIITSKIVVSKNPLSYAENRSIYTSKERFEQTMSTITSIRKYIPNSYIILFDNSCFLNSDYNILNNAVDHFINITNNEDLNYFTNEYKYKAFAELAQLREIYKHAQIDIKNIKHLFKISGRYLLNDTFDYAAYNNDKNIFKKNMSVTDRNYYYTSFYKLNKTILPFFFKKIDSIFNKREQYTQHDLEVIFSTAFNENIDLVDNLGVTQNISVWNEISNI